jgi:hypothetical protein
MPADLFVRVNNTRYSWTSSRFLIEGIPTEGLVAVDYEHSRECDIVYASRQDGTPLGWTSGKYGVKSFKLKFLKEYAQAFKNFLATIGAGSFGDAEWTFLAQFVEPVLGSIPITLVASPCKVTAERASHEEGMSALLTEFDLAVLQVIEGATPLFSIVRALGV